MNAKHSENNHQGWHLPMLALAAGVFFLKKKDQIYCARGTVPELHIKTAGL
jgi:hypothetical protein